MKEVLRRILPDRVKKVLMKVCFEYQERYYFNSRLTRYPPVFVFQMGKVGSTSIYESLLEFYPGVVLHGHRFHSHHENWKFRRLYNWAVLRKRPLKIISLTREPLGRNVSAFFQNFERETIVPYEKANFSIEDLRLLFLSRYRHDIPLEWFDKNIRETFGIDVYASPFPSSGYATYSNANVRLLVMRCEIRDEEKVKVIKDFLGLEQFQLLRKNVGEEKDYAATYREFRDKVKLPPEYIAKMCESRYFTHFYDAATIDGVREKWGASG
jgi:hypothetical protein